MHARLLSTVFVVVFVVLVVVAVATETLCKKPCECTAGGYVDCTNRALTSTNSALARVPAAARVLNLSSNAFPTLYRRMFVAASDLRVLVVSRCGVETIDGDALHGLASLETLYCTNNRLETLDPSTFHATPSIQKIVFFRNALRRVDAGSFSGLKHLLHVDLSYNSIERVDAGSFGHNPRLVSVSLNANRLTRLDTIPFVPRLRTLSLDANRLVCGCGLISLRTWIDDGRRIDVRNATCDSPPAAARRLFENVTVVDLHCWSSRADVTAHEPTATRSERCERPNRPNRDDEDALCERFVCGVDNGTYSLAADGCGRGSNGDPDRRSGVGSIAATLCGLVALAAISVGAIVFVVRRRRRGKNVNGSRADDAVGFGRRSSGERTTRPTVSEPQPDGEYEENYLYGLRIS